MSSEQEFDEGFQEDVAQDESAGEAAPADDQATDADFTDEDWSDADDAGEGDGEGEGGLGDEGGSDQKAAKKKKMNLMLLGGAVVVGLGVAYMTMHKKSVPVPPPTNVPVPVAEPTQTDMIYADANRDKDSDKADKKKKLDKSGFLTDPNLIKQAQKLSDSHVPSEDETTPESVAHPAMPSHDKPPQPAPIKQVDVDEDDNQPLTPMPQATAGDVTKPTGTSPTPPTNTTMPPVGQTPSADTQKPETASTTATSPAMNSTMTPSVATPALNPTTASAPTETTTAAPMSNAQLESITSKLDGIENQIKTLEGSVVHRDELADIHAQIDALSKRMDSLATSGVKATSEHAANAGHTGSHAAKSRHAASRHATSASKPQTAHPNVWMLKSAMPGMAMIAGSNGQMMTIKPGDRVVGLGRIRSIAEKNGRWVVTGTAGSVHQ